MKIDKASGIPLYHQLQDYLRAKIERGDWEVGDKIPTEQQLSQQFRVSRITVIKAVNRLVEEGLLQREQGRGTFVTAPPEVPESLPLRSFTEEMRERGLNPSSRILNMDEIVPPKRLQTRLALEESVRVWKIERLRYANGEAVGLHRTYLPTPLFPALDTQIQDAQSLYQVLATAYGVVPDEAVETYSAVQLDNEECRLLALPLGSPAFAVERLTYARGTPIEFVTALMRSDVFHYTVRLHRK